MNVCEEHAAIDELLPLYANGTLDIATRAHVARHLVECARCREELAFIGEIRDVMRQSAAKETGSGRGGGFESLPAELRAAVTSSAEPVAVRGWKSTALAASVFAALALGIALTVTRLETPQFRTATTATDSVEAVIVEVRFEPGAGAEQVGRLLREHRAVVLHGPGHEDRWTLEIPVGEHRSEQELMETLRRTGGVAEVTLREAPDQ